MVSNGSGTTDIKKLWKYIDPKADNIPTLSARPAPADINSVASSISNLTAIKLEDFKYRKNLWKEEKMEKQEIKERLEAVRRKILGSFSESLLPRLKTASNF
ncbi:hypothetical protein EPUL_006762 [Erysiphe pulchra]|uniref:Uncharacterized protein n=1 Tax=Erysiphe pulchra TaxID=225359 RepID=A0A2S4PSW8_9PEZI|nr:hypothetical protein EPUL_006762 [Erysiphe pulchra]